MAADQNEFFERYFVECEETFNEEMKQLLDRVNLLKQKWRETIDSDTDTINLVKELVNLKHLLRRGQLQVLRTKEEILHVRQKNFQIAFRIRHLKTEIRKFLPFTNESEPTIEYILSMDKTNTEENQELIGKNIHYAADEQLKNGLKSVLDDWKSLISLQDEAINEDIIIQKVDDEQFKLFKQDYENNNKNTHELLDDIHRIILSKLLELQSLSNKENKTKESELASIKNRICNLEAESNSLNERLADKLDKAKNDFYKKLRSTVRVLNEEIRSQEQSIGQKALESTILKNSFQKQFDDINNSIAKLKNTEKKLLERREAQINSANDFIKKLEGGMNALVAASTAVTENYMDTTLSVIKALSTAVETHGYVANESEMYISKLENITRRLIELTSNL